MKKAVGALLALLTLVSIALVTVTVTSGAQAAINGCTTFQENWQDPGADGSPNTMLVWPGTNVQYSSSQRAVPNSGSTCTRFVILSFHSWSTREDVCADMWIRHGIPGTTWTQGPVRTVCPGSGMTYLGEGIPDNHSYRLYVDILYFNPVVERFPAYIRYQV